MFTWNFGPCSKRAAAWEWIDMPDLSDDDLIQTYEFIESMERLCGGYRIVLHFLKAWSKKWAPGMPVRILDLYCGRGALAREIRAWGEAAGFDIYILAADRFGRIIEAARDKTPDSSRIIYEVRDWNDRSFLESQQFDYVISSLSLHRQPAGNVVPFLKNLDRLAKRGVIVTDWVRDVRALFWMKTIVRFSENEVIKKDGPLAIRKGFAVGELQKLIQDAGMNYAHIQKHLGYRFSLAGERAFVYIKKPVPAARLAGA